MLAARRLSSSLSRRPLSTLAAPAAGVDFDSFGFGLNGVRTEWMWQQTFDSEKGEWDAGGLVPHAPLSLEPSATILNYGQGIFEGLKAFRQPDGGVALFRPDMNAARMREGGARMMMPDLPAEAFLGAVESVVAANAKWVPPHKSGTLYLRPLLFGSGAALGVSPSPITTFCVYASPVGNYFKGGAGEAPPISLGVAEKFRRAMPGGSGGTKAAGNYAPCFMASKEAKAAGYSEVLFIDSASSSTIEEAGASNFFAVVPATSGGYELATCPTSAGTILPGVTRSSVLTIAREELVGKLSGTDLTGVAERQIHLDELAHWKEGFCTGTGASVTSVGSVAVPAGIASGPIEYSAGGWGEVTKAVANRLFSTQWGECEDTRGWLHHVKG